MAEAPAPKKTLTDTLELMEKQVQCPICLETYREPKALACLHAYCRECVQQLLLRQRRDQEVECPQCRSVVAVAGNDPSSLPTVFFINGLIEVCDILKKVESNEIACQNCSEAKATSFCRTCSMFICASCNNAHKKMKVFESHKTIAICELKEGSLIQLPTKNPLTCKKHEEEMKLYCFKCEQLICRDCTLVDHAGHKFDFVRGVADAFREEVLSSLVPLRDTYASITTAIANVEGTKKEIRDQGADIAATIARSFKELHAILDNREQVLLKQTREVVGRKVGVLDRQKEDLQLRMATLDSLVGFIERTAENASDEEFISMKHQITSRVQEVGQKYKRLELAPAEVANIGKVMPQADGLRKLLQKQCAVYVSVVDASKCDIAGPGLKSAIVQQATEFTVRACDTRGNPAAHVSADLKSLVDGSVLQVTVVSQTPSTYVFSFTPTTRGHHQLTVRVNNTEIRTFQVFVLDPPTQLGASMRNIIHQRYVLLCGDSGGGKSTVANLLARYDPLSLHEAPFRVSHNVRRSVSHCSVMHHGVEYCQNNVVHRIEIFDITIGDNFDRFKENFERYLRDHIMMINVVLLILKKGSVTIDKKISKFVRDLMSASALVVTGCEFDNAEARAAICEELRVNKDTQQIAAQMKMGIYPVGFPPVSLLETMTPELQHFYQQKMLNDQSTLLDLVFQAGEGVLTNKLFK